VAGSFGLARLIFQSGYLAEVHNSTSQDLVDARRPLFFAATGFGVSAVYTFFLLSAAEERYKTHPVPSG
jgi:RND superfamily putative drug exporter